MIHFMTGKSVKSIMGEGKISSQDKSLHINENSSGSQHYQYQTFSNASTSVFPSFSASAPGASAAPPSSAFPPAFPASYPPAAGQPIPDFYTRQPTNYFPPS